jgi:hypothetical protein
MPAFEELEPTRYGDILMNAFDERRETLEINNLKNIMSEVIFRKENKNENYIRTNTLELYN